MNVVPLRPEVQDDYFGSCPKCGKHDGFLNVGKTHWFHCDEHKTRWSPGSGLFSPHPDETEADHIRNQDRLGYYREVEPVFSAERRREK